MQMDLDFSSDEDSEQELKLETKSKKLKIEKKSKKLEKKQKKVEADAEAELRTNIADSDKQSPFSKELNQETPDIALINRRIQETKRILQNFKEEREMCDCELILCGRDDKPEICENSSIRLWLVSLVFLGILSIIIAFFTLFGTVLYVWLPSSIIGGFVGWWVVLKAIEGVWRRILRNKDYNCPGFSILLSLSVIFFLTILALFVLAFTYPGPACENVAITGPLNQTQHEPLKCQYFNCPSNYYTFNSPTHGFLSINSSKSRIEFFSSVPAFETVEVVYHCNDFTTALFNFDVKINVPSAPVSQNESPAMSSVLLFVAMLAVLLLFALYV